VTDLHVVVPEGIDDPRRPSGGNTYDRRVLDGLRALGWAVHEHGVAGSWPHPRAAELEHLAHVVAGVPAGSVLLVDGLVGCCADRVLVREACRLRVAVLVHLPLGAVDPDAAAAEGRVLQAALAVVATSGWTRDLLLDTYGLAPAAVSVAAPGVDAAPVSPGSGEVCGGGGGHLLCVAAVTPAKGHLDLVAALAPVADLPWRCVCAGALTLDGGHVARVRDRLAETGLSGRVDLAGPLTGTALEEAYAAADLLVLPSLAETYGMVVTEALARGIPVIATEAGGVPEAMGFAEHGRPGLLVAAGEPDRLAGALRSWLTDGVLRARLRDRALERRRTLTGWGRTAQLVSTVLRDVLEGAP
jgi:glycosyltransferase involved in cell wall biosynthesis